ELHAGVERKASRYRDIDAGAQGPGTGPVRLVRRREIARVVVAEVFDVALSEEDLSSNARVQVWPDQSPRPSELRPDGELREIVCRLHLHLNAADRRAQRDVLCLVAVVDDARAETHRERPALVEPEEVG